MEIELDPELGLEITPQGYLVKRGCNIARLIALEYAGSEIGYNDRPDEIFTVYRDEKELFNPETIKSFEGMPVTIIHPPNLEVNADDWKEKSAGHVQNVRREGEYLVCDVYIQDAAAIEILKLTGIKEISCGYDSVLIYQDGKIWQTKIRGNHVAIVREGRCGDTCKLGDRGLAMNKLSKTKIADSLSKHLQKLKALKIGDSAEEAASDATDTLEDAKQAVTEAIELVEEVKKEVEAAPDGQPIADAEGTDPSDDKDAKIAELESQIEEKDAKIAELEEELKKRDEASETSTVVADAALRFPKTKLGDAKTAREARERILVDTKAFSKADMKSMTDAEIRAAYVAVSAINPAKGTSALGSKILGDSKIVENSNLSGLFGGKK